MFGLFAGIHIIYDMSAAAREILLLKGQRSEGKLAEDWGV